MSRRPPIPTLFPYTTLFRSNMDSPAIDERLVDLGVSLDGRGVAVEGVGFAADTPANPTPRSEEHTSELQSHSDLVCRLLLEKKKKNITTDTEETSNNTSKRV